MPRIEMPILVRLSQRELAQLLGRSELDNGVQRLGGLTVVLRPSAAQRQGRVPPDLVGPLGAPTSLHALAGAFREVEPALFRRLKASPALAKRYVLEPAAALSELERESDAYGLAK
jgi:hypothetical protein